MRGNRTGNLVGCIAIGAAIHPGRLVGWIIGQLVLEEVGASAIAIPDNLVLLIMLNKQAIGCNVAAIHYQAISSCIRSPIDATAMIGSPEPHMISNDIITVDNQTLRGFPNARASDAEKDIA